MCWWCCMRLLEKCLPRNDIVRELAPYLQHVHTEDEEERPSTHNSSDAGANGTNAAAAPRSPRAPAEAEMVRCGTTTSQAIGRRSRPNTPHDPACYFVAYEDKNTLPPRVPGGCRSNPNLLPIRHGSRGSVDDRLLLPRSNSGKAHDDWDINPSHEGFTLGIRGRRRNWLAATHNTASGGHCGGVLPHVESSPSTGPTKSRSSTDVRVDMTMDNVGILMGGAPLEKKPSAPRIKTDLGDLTTVRWDKCVIVQVSVKDFRDKMGHAKDLMEDAKLLYEHTVLSRLSSEYGGQEILHQSRSGLFVIAFTSEFHAAKWCLSLQLSLVYAAWSDKLLKHFDDLREVYSPIDASGKSKKGVLLYRGFRVRMVIHTANHILPAEKSLAEAVKWTNSVSNFVHGGQIVLSESVWDRLKEQLVQLGNPVVEDLGGYSVNGDAVQLMLLLPRDLELRRFPKLESSDQVSLGMRDAPSAYKPVTMVFTFIEGARPLVRCHAEELADRIKTLCTVARQLLRKYDGYECQELQGDFMLAFFDPKNAILWCSEFQMRIRQRFREWNRESENKDLMFSMSMGIETGVPASVSPHKTSGRADYFGNIVNQTARIAKAAHGGQILIGGDAWKKYVTEYFESDMLVKKQKVFDDAHPESVVVQFVYHGHYAFKGISAPIALIETIPVDTHSTSLTSGLRLIQSRAPKAKKVEDAQMRTQDKADAASVPTDMVRLIADTEDKFKYKDTIRETELGASFSFGDSIVMVEDINESDEEDAIEEGHPPASALGGTMAFAVTNPRLASSSGLLQLLRHSSGHSSGGSDRNLN